MHTLYTPIKHQINKQLFLQKILTGILPFTKFPNHQNLYLTFKRRYISHQDLLMFYYTSILQLF